MTQPFRPLAPLRLLGRIATGRLPGQVVIQYTDRCNAACAQCGMRKSNPAPRSSMDMNEARRLLDNLAARGVAAISFTGGEPLLHLDEICALAAHARSLGIAHVRTGTNGFVFKGHDRPDFPARMRDLAEKLLEAGFSTFWISLDSADPGTHEANRGLSGIVRGMEKALPLFHASGLYPSANLGLNRFTGGAQPLPLLDPDRAGSREEFREEALLALCRFYRRVRDLGFTIANACYPMSGEDAAVYAASSAAEMISFSREEKRELFGALYDAVERHRHVLRIFTPRSSLLALMRDLDRAEGDRLVSAPCRGGRDFFYVGCADMRAYPCGYRGDEPIGPAVDLDPALQGKGEECRRCEWECFRDPSELAAPLLDIFTRPAALAARFWSDRTYAREWLNDLRYYRACGWFDATKPPDMGALERFRNRSQEGVCPRP